jgi:hypothetical protein
MDNHDEIDRLLTKAGSSWRAINDPVLDSHVPHQEATNGRIGPGIAAAIAAAAVVGIALWLWPTTPSVQPTPQHTGVVVQPQPPSSPSVLPVQTIAPTVAPKRQTSRPSTAESAEASTSRLSAETTSNLGREVRRLEEALGSMADSALGDRATLLHGLGVLYFELGKTEQATAAFDAALTLANDAALPALADRIRADRARLK